MNHGDHCNWHASGALGVSRRSLLSADPETDKQIANALGLAFGGVGVSLLAAVLLSCGLLLAFVLAGIAWLLPFQGFTLSQGFTPWALIALGSTCLLYGLHELKIIRMPYPQLRKQVSHGARMDLPKWVTGLLYVSDRDAGEAGKRVRARLGIG